MKFDRLVHSGRATTTSTTSAPGFGFPMRLYDRVDDDGYLQNEPVLADETTRRLREPRNRSVHRESHGWQEIGHIMPNHLAERNSARAQNDYILAYSRNSNYSTPPAQTSRTGKSVTALDSIEAPALGASNLTGRTISPPAQSSHPPNFCKSHRTARRGSSKPRHR